ncbi:sensor protein QseC [mine drainage metagenome]|uniref:histidine kinase n=1 Tax=mine drainage metagenome TaxID=410659 RepID=A0A1J5SUC6_9ZZZZ
MKLFTKYNRINISATIFTFMLGSIAFYFVLDYVLTRQLKETLRSEQFEIIHFIEEHHTLPEFQNTRNQWITAEKSSEKIKRPRFQNSSYYNEREKENESVKQLLFTVDAGGQNFLITVNKSEAETEDLLKLIILVTIGMIALILLFNYLINRKLINKIWQPFYKTIDDIKTYQVSDKQPLQLSKEQIDELNLLNDSLNKMTQSIYREYAALKSFTENASHEMQTPLAVIRSKIDLLLQQSELNEQSLQQILSIEDAAQRLSKLHQSLLLLTKIENKQFVLNEAVDLKKIILEKIKEREELIDSKKLKIETNCKEVVLSFHHHLAEILFNNLLNNVIKYTPENGTINIELNEDFICFKNDATKEALDVNKIFQRFYKPSDSRDGTGLGLAIIKEICNLAGFDISYSFNNHQHIFLIKIKTIE